MSRHLSPSQIESALNRCKSVEQFLGATSSGNLSWLELRPEGDSIQIWQFEVSDDGSLSFADIYSFSPVNGASPVGPVCIKKDFSEALLVAERNYGAKPDHWVNQFMIQDEYLDFKRKTAEQGAAANP